MSVTKERAQHEKDLKDLREQQEADVLRRVAVRPSEVHEEIWQDTVNKKGETERVKVGEIHAFAGNVYLEVKDGKFSRDDWAIVQGYANAAFQAVT
jgi:hypothetical protein